MQNYTLIILWSGGRVTQTPFASRQLAMAALDDIKVTEVRNTLRESTLANYIESAVIVQNVAEEPTRRAKP